MENLFKVIGGTMWAVLGKIADKLPAELADGLNRDPLAVDAMIKAADEHLNKNPFEISVEETLNRARRAYQEEGWGEIPQADLTRLEATAPAWPKDRHAYRSLRIRFGEGDRGVDLTFECHVARIKSVFTEKEFWRWKHLHSGKVPYKGKPVERLRLLNGNHTHKPIIEWVIVDLSTHRKRESVTAVRGPKSLADELLVLAWSFPEMIRAIDYDKLPGLFAAGYEVNVPEDAGEVWLHVVIVSWNHRHHQVSVDAFRRSNANSDYSVPSLQK